MKTGAEIVCRWIQQRVEQGDAPKYSEIVWQLEMAIEQEKEQSILKQSTDDTIKEELIELCKEFCKRVEKGEVRSTYTYSEMKTSILYALLSLFLLTTGCLNPFEWWAVWLVTGSAISAGVVLYKLKQYIEN